MKNLLDMRLAYSICVSCEKDHHDLGSGLTKAIISCNRIAGLGPLMMV